MGIKVYCTMWLILEHLYFLKLHHLAHSSFLCARLGPAQKLTPRYIFLELGICKQFLAYLPFYRITFNDYLPYYTY